MKSAVLFIAIVAAGAASLPTQSSPTSKPEVAPQPPPASPSPVTVVIDNAQRSVPKPSEGNAPPERALVVVGIITAAFICWQAWESRKSAQAMRDSIPLQQQAASATNLIAISTLRPKLIIRGITLVQGTLVPVVDGSQVVEDATTWQIECLIANVGGSVAYIVESNMTVAGIDIRENKLPVFPPYGESLNWLEKSDIRHGEHKQISVKLGESNTMRFRILTHMHHGRGHVVSNTFCLGFIQYRDDAKVERRTAFCFRYHVGTQGFERITDPNYDYSD